MIAFSETPVPAEAQSGPNGGDDDKKRNALCKDQPLYDRSVGTMRKEGKAPGKAQSPIAMV